MEIRIKGKIYKIPWEFLVVPFIMLLILSIILISNYSYIKEVWIELHSKNAPEYSRQDAELSGEERSTKPLGGKITSDSESALSSTYDSTSTSNSSSASTTTVTSPSPSADTPSSSASSSKASKVNINTAGMEELMTLPYIGEVKAKAIIEYRRENGNFSSVEELDKVKGIGEKTIEKLKPFITVK